MRARSLRWAKMNSTTRSRNSVVTMRNKILITLSVLTAASFVQAQPDTRPPADTAQRSADQPRRGPGVDGMGSRFRGFSGRSQQEPTEDEWVEVGAFMKEHSPHRWRMYQAAPEGHQGRLRGPIFSAWKNITRLERDDKEMYDLRLKRLPIEDDIFALAGESKKSGERTPEIQLQLRLKVAAFMESRMQERKLRIARLEKALREERHALSEFESQREDVIETRTREVVSQGPGALREHSERPEETQHNASPEPNQSPRR